MFLLLFSSDNLRLFLISLSFLVTIYVTEVSIKSAKQMSAVLQIQNPDIQNMCFFDVKNNRGDISHWPPNSRG